MVRVEMNRFGPFVFLVTTWRRGRRPGVAENAVNRTLVNAAYHEKRNSATSRRAYRTCEAQILNYLRATDIELALLL